MERCDRTGRVLLKIRCVLCLSGLPSSLGVFFILMTNQGSADVATIVVQGNQPGARISSNLFGVFFEEINSAGDGGIYAEMVRNRSFEDSTNSPAFWTLVTSGTAVGQMSLDRSLPLSPTNPQSLKLTMSSGTGTVGAANSGYWGISLTQGATCNLGLYARASPGFTGTITVSLENSSGSSVYAQGAVNGLTATWQNFFLVLIPNHTDPAARLVLRVSQPGSVWLDFVSLFPQQTFNLRTNGLRPDLATLLVNLKPSFVRFPGGSWIDGASLANAYHWEPTIGDPANRLERMNLWGYMVGNGLGYHEYLQMCEDLGAQPLFVVNCGMDVNQNAVPTNQLASWVQEAVDAIQYANGDVSTPWGAQRAANGHPAPFNLQYIEIGNENGGAAYNNNYALFYDAIKGAYPDLHIIADSWGGIPNSRPVEIMDEHYYSNPAFFINAATKYDGYSRNGPKVYVGEYAVTGGSGNGNLAGALGEAAFMTGLERNGDIVAMASYAPLFANLNNKNWNPDLIYFNGAQVYGTPSYHVQQMFSLNRGDFVLPTAVSATLTSVVTPTNHGAIGLSTWNTQAAFSNVVVAKNGQTIFQSDFTGGNATGWQITGGTWIVTNGLFEQTASGMDNRVTAGDPAWSDYTLTLRAQKLGGSEGFLIMFNVQDSGDLMWLNIGGWNNTQTAIEYEQNGSRTVIPGTAFAQTLATGQWYTIQVQLNGPHILCYLNGQLIEDIYTSVAHQGAIGLGTWNTQCAFSNVLVTTTTQTLYQSDFTQGSTGWQPAGGTWTTSNGSFQQTAGGTGNTATYGSSNWVNYTYSLNAKKLSGSEGFLILFNVANANNWMWWNIGGWNNTQTGIEYAQNGTKSLLAAVPMTIQSGQWYNIRIELGDHIRCYLDGQLIHDVPYPDATLPLVASSAFSQDSGDIIVKAVNVSPVPLTTTFSLNGLAAISPQATVVQLSSANPLAENSLATPTNIVPSTNAITNAGTNFACSLPANSLSILRLHTRPVLPIQIQLDATTNLNLLASPPAGISVSLSSFSTNTVLVNFVVETAHGSPVTNGTLSFAPGTVSANITLPPGILQPGAFFRVTLSSPVNGLLGNVARAYFAEESGSNDPLTLGLAIYPDEKLVYWTHPLVTPFESTNLAGPWTVLTNATGPVRIPESAPAKFFRLRQ